MVPSLLGWILIAPLAALMPRRRDWIAVIGRADGQFLDNAKYFFLQGAPLLQPGVRMVFLTEREDVVQLLAGTDYEVVRYPSVRSTMLLLRCGVTVIDSSEWFGRMRRFLLVRTRLVQLWHGVGFKRIGLDKWRNQAHASRMLSWPAINLLRRWMHRLTGRLVRYDIVNTTSVFYRDEVFKGALPSRHYLVCGYPRNTFGTLGGTAQDVAARNLDQNIASRVAQWQAEGRRIVLVTPTFRDSRVTPMGLTADVVAMLEAFCEQQRVELVFKFHLLEEAQARIHGQHLHAFDASADLYPLMPASSAMITDYSSIYMDYLLLDKPVLFLVPDLEQYIRDDRQIQFDFEAMTPGPKLASWEKVIGELEAQWQHDTYASRRAHLRQLAFDNQDQHQAVPRLIEFMSSHGWIRGKK
jgi:CDP-glycerol glycerophosphotransferase (TagB/SpsB family)